jgi:hypothetical protein
VLAHQQGDDRAERGDLLGHHQQACAQVVEAIRRGDAGRFGSGRVV